MNAIPKGMITNAVRRLETIFPGFFTGAKHNHYSDFGWPENLAFEQLYAMYARNGLGAAAVRKTARKTWQSQPFLREVEEGEDETEVERLIRRRFQKLRVWQRMAEADRRGMVGRYSALILRFADGKRFADPVDRVPGGLDGLVEVIPAWEAQLRVSEWDTDEMSDTYGQPLMFSFNEAAVIEGLDAQGRNRAHKVHPDRVIVWSEDGTVHCRSALEPGFNDLMTLEKVGGAGGEGFWKNAKSSPVLQVDQEAKLAQMAQAMGVQESELIEAMNDRVEDWQKGFDKLLMLQGIEAKTLGITLPSPEHFRLGPLENFAASMGIPVKVLVGMQTGERASKEDADEWAETCMARRADFIIPNIMEFANRLEKFGVLPERDWRIEWADLTESSMSDKVDRADKMAGINQKNAASGGELVYLPEEIRAATGHRALADSEIFLDE